MFRTFWVFANFWVTQAFYNRFFSLFWFVIGHLISLPTEVHVHFLTGFLISFGSSKDFDSIITLILPFI